MTTVLIILSCIVFTIICIYVGYKIAILRWQPKDLLKRVEKYEEVNKELGDGIKKLDSAMQSNITWYIQQLQALGSYMREKHNDNYVNEQLKNLLTPGAIVEEVEEINLNLNEILDKASEEGIESLTEKETEYLKKYKEQ